MKRLVAALLLLNACTARTTPVTPLSAVSSADAAAIPAGTTPEEHRELFRAALELHARNDHVASALLFERIAAHDSVLGDHALRYLAEIAAERADRVRSRESWRAVVERFPRSVWRGRALVALAEGHYEDGACAEATALLEAARREALEPNEEATLLWVESRCLRLNGETESARRRTADLRSRFSGSREARDAREEAWQERDVALASAGEAEAEITRLLAEDPRRALELARLALRRFPAPRDQAELAWLEASALSRSGRSPDAEVAFETVQRRFAGRPQAARALYRLAAIAWNRDDDRLALRLFELYARAYPRGEQAAEALYAAGRIHHEARRYRRASDAFERLVRRHPRSSLAGEAAWRIAWSHYKAREYRTAARTFDRFVSAGRPERSAALYWRARSLERLNDSATDVYDEILADFPGSYYAWLAEKRVGRPEGAALSERRDDSLPGAGTLPDSDDPHLLRFRALRQIGAYPLARLELAAFERTAAGGADDPAVLAAWLQVEGFRQAIRTAARLDGCKPESPIASFCYPLAFWPTVQRESERSAIDPFLVLALMRQESLFDPRAVSPANARGLMQLLPATAERTLRGLGATLGSIDDLFDAERNLAVGIAHLRELLDRYEGNEPRALAAYNAGAAAVEKWIERYGVLEDDEFVDSISFRETREYVKRVLQNRRIYRVLYVATAPPLTVDERTGD